jgi:hypothetical protein
MMDYYGFTIKTVLPIEIGTIGYPLLYPKDGYLV